jgi:flagellar basal-body rod modification protein FlgD
MSTIQPANALASQGQPLSQFARAQAQDDGGEQASGSRGALASDFNTFLTLLTAQMKNQDPLNPADSTEFVAQLAQFSSVEQQIATNETLESILETLAASGQGALVDWLGTEVKAAVPASFSGNPIATFPEAPELDAATAALIVTDASGKVVAEQRFEPGTDTVTWDGTTSSGAAALAGRYDFSVRYANEAGETENAGASVLARVVEAKRDGADTILVLQDGGTVNAKDVSGVRQAG